MYLLLCLLLVLAPATYCVFPIHVCHTYYLYKKVLDSVDSIFALSVSSVDSI